LEFGGKICDRDLTAEFVAFRFVFFALGFHCNEVASSNT
jgi:hypothetical protein